MQSLHDEFDRLVTGQCYAILTGWSVVTLSGADRANLAQNFTTNDVKRLAPGGACESMFTDVKGRVLAFGLVGCDADRLVVLLGSERAHLLAKHLERYRIREDVKIEAPNGVFIVAHTLADEPGFPFEALGSSWRVATAERGASLLKRLHSRGIRAASEAAFEAFRVERQLPRDGLDVDDHTLPQELARDAAAISFTKGCYLGQETVARIDALGHVNRLLVGLTFQGDPPPTGVELTDEGLPAGKVTSVSPLTCDGVTAGLGYVRRALATAGRRLSCGQGNALVRD